MACGFLHHARKMVRRLEAAAFGDLGNAESGIRQQSDSLVHTIAPDKLHRRCMFVLSEQADKMLRGDTGVVGHFGQRAFACQTCCQDSY